MENTNAHTPGLTFRVIKGMNSLKRPYYVRLSNGQVLTSPTGLTSTFASPEAAIRAASKATGQS